MLYAAKIALEDDRREEAASYVADVLEDESRAALTFGTIDLAWLATELGRAEEVRVLLAAWPRSTPYHDAAAAILDGDYVRAADLLDGRRTPASARGTGVGGCGATNAPKRMCNCERRWRSSARWALRGMCARLKRSSLLPADNWRAGPGGATL